MIGILLAGNITFSQAISWTYKKCSVKTIEKEGALIPKGPGFKVLPGYGSWVAKGVMEKSRGFQVFRVNCFLHKNEHFLILEAPDQPKKKGRDLIEFIRYEGFLPYPFQKGDTWIYFDTHSVSCLAIGDMSQRSGLKQIKAALIKGSRSDK